MPYFLQDNGKDWNASAAPMSVLEKAKNVSQSGEISDIEKILGVKQDTPMTFDEANELRGNPKFAKDFKSADFILKKKNFIGTYDLKTIMGESSAGNRLLESIGQTRRILLNITTDYNPRQLAKDVRHYFETKKEAIEVKIFKGKLEFQINRDYAMNKNFLKMFINEYNLKK